MVLKAVVDVHSSAVVSVRCFVQGGGGGGGGGGGSAGSSDPAAITADVEGVVNKMCFRRVMWTKWVVDTECLLDGELLTWLLAVFADSTAGKRFFSQSYTQTKERRGAGGGGGRDGGRRRRNTKETRITG